MATPTTTLRHRLSGDLTGGVLLLVAALAGIVWANSPWRAAYATMSDTVVGPAAWHLDLTLAAWAADGLLAVFFLVVGLELKRELVAGSLRDPRHAAVPALAAIGGMVVPAGVFAAVVGWGGGDGLHGWAVPTATDIAFALAVLALVGRGLPGAARVFLLTLAVVDDLLAIVVIAVVYADEIRLPWLLAAAAAVAAFAGVVRIHPRHRSARSGLVVLLVVLGLTAWVTLHASGIHATIAGVACGLAVPAAPGADGRPSLASRLEHHVRPWSAAVAAPVFAFFAAGVALTGRGDVVAQPVAWGVLLGLVVGKPVGVLGTTALLTRFTPLRLPGGLRVRDLWGVGLLAGVGFTVSLLVAQLAFDDGTLADAATLAVFAGSLVSAVAAAVVLRMRGRAVQRGSGASPARV
ncbi:MAG TPA: Na+/H+ antiporter NhaA [Cellulomonas sp.]